MIKYIVVVFISIYNLFSNSLNAQNIEFLDVVNLSDSVYRVNIDSLDFIFVGELKERNRPLVVFIQGSSNVPVLFSFENSYFYMMDTNTFQNKQFNYIISSKIGVPLISSYENVKSNSVIDSVSLNTTVECQNTLSNLSRKYESIIEKSNLFLHPRSIFLIGHSQGARIAFNMASQHTFRYSKVACLSMNPMGRLYSYYRQTGDDLLFNYFTDNPKLDSLVWGETVESWLSYSKPLFGDFITIDIPCFVGYGKLDDACLDCQMYSLLSTYNNNLNYREYPNLDHNFFLVNDVDSKDSKKNIPKWGEVIGEVYDWFLE